MDMDYQLPELCNYQSEHLRVFHVRWYLPFRMVWEVVDTMVPGMTTGLYVAHIDRQDEGGIHYCIRSGTEKEGGNHTPD